MENRIKEQQLYLFADRTSNSKMRSNQILYFSSAAYQSLRVLSPRDAFEGVLISQMLAVYHQDMECFQLANIDYNRLSLDLFTTLQNQGVKLMRMFAAQMEALNKYRTGGQQKMTVEHVHVHKGGQAIVGNVTEGGRNNGK